MVMDIIDTWRALQARLKAVSRSVGEVALEGLLDSAREPPIRRDHFIPLVDTHKEERGTYKVHSARTA